MQVKVKTAQAELEAKTAKKRAKRAKQKVRLVRVEPGVSEYQAHMQVTFENHQITTSNQ